MPALHGRIVAEFHRTGTKKMLPDTLSRIRQYRQKTREAAGLKHRIPFLRATRAARNRASIPPIRHGHPAAPTCRHFSGPAYRPCAAIVRRHRGAAAIFQSPYQPWTSFCAFLYACRIPSTGVMYDATVAVTLIPWRSARAGHQRFHAIAPPTNHSFTGYSPFPHPHQSAQGILPSWMRPWNREGRAWESALWHLP